MAAGIGGGIPILDVGCGVSVNLNSALSTIDNMINDILNGIDDITGAIADAVSSAIGELGTALGKMIPDLSGLIPDISLSGAIEGLLGLVEGSVEYLAKLAEITLQFGEAILEAGLNLFDMVADAAGALLKGLNPCSALPTDLALTAAGVVPKPFNISFPTVAGIAEIAAPKVIFNRITKPIQGKLGTPNPLFGGAEGTSAEYNLYGTSYGRLPEKEIIVELANTSDDED